MLRMHSNDGRTSHRRAISPSRNVVHHRRSGCVPPLSSREFAGETAKMPRVRDLIQAVKLSCQLLPGTAPRPDRESAKNSYLFGDHSY